MKLNPYQGLKQALYGESKGRKCFNEAKSLSGIETGRGSRLGIGGQVLMKLNPYQGLKLK